jgi:diadenosine tetraphosphate (Ap4A) HIT family hydrolase
MDDAGWKALFVGAGCPMDAPREAWQEHRVATLSISSLYLNLTQTYRGHCTLIFDARHACQLDQLTRAERTAFATDLLDAHGAVMSVVRPDHINLELLGNVVPHLHWHIVPRYFSDPRWGMPIWTTPLSAMPDVRLEEGDRQALIESIRAALPR